MLVGLFATILGKPNAVKGLCWELNQAANTGDETDNAFKRHDPMCAARPLTDHDAHYKRLCTPHALSLS
jgi:hypothetical protein